MNYTFEPYRKDGSPRRYVGMFKPPYEDALREGLLKPPRPQLIARAGEERDRWAHGAADRPLYEDDGTQSGTSVALSPDDPQNVGSKPEPRE